MRRWLALVLASLHVAHGADTMEKLVLPPPKDLLRADLHVWRGTERPRGVLVLVPGANGNGESLIRRPEWQEFARQHRLGLVGVSFASEVSLLHQQRGYYYASQGSGETLLSVIRKAFGRDLPVLLFGFSGGAHFTSRFVEWKPQRVIGWCAYSAGWWDEPMPTSVAPPGIVGCGEEDPRLGASLTYFKQGRARGRPWLWIGIPRVGHASPPQFEAFVRDYFDAVLKRYGKPYPRGLWVDIDRFHPVDPAREPLSVTAWLPEAALHEGWKQIVTP